MLHVYCSSSLGRELARDHNAKYGKCPNKGKFYSKPFHTCYGYASDDDAASVFQCPRMFCDTGCMSDLGMNPVTRVWGWGNEMTTHGLYPVTRIRVKMWEQN